MFLDNDVKLDFSDVLIIPKRNQAISRSDIDLNRTIKFLYSPYEYYGVPIIASNMTGVGTFDVHDVLAKHRVMTAICKHYTFEDWENNKNKIDTDYIILSTGISENDLNKAKEIVDRYWLRYVMIDVANGYSERFCDFIKKFRDEYPDVCIMAGNVATKEMTEALIIAGADVVKCGIGSGSVCRTRLQTGVGYPQLSCVIECANYAHGLNASIISDGGCTNIGDISKAFCAGADFVQLGSMLAGHQESGQEIITKYKKKEYLDSPEDSLYEEHQFVEFYGMSSKKAQENHFGGFNDYRASEGREVLVPYKGLIENTIKEILGGIRSTCTYIGSKTIKQMPKCASFVRVNNQVSKFMEKYEK